MRPAWRPACSASCRSSGTRTARRSRTRRRTPSSSTCAVNWPAPRKPHHQPRSRDEARAAGAAGQVTSPAVSPSEPGRLAVALAGAVSLAVAMGIGRFAFTPLLPMMLHDGVIDLHAASWLASANYFGYLVGALLCTFQPWIWARARWLPPIDGPWLVRAGLVATGLLTLGMALPAAVAWPLLRFAAGVASSLVFVYTSGW